jgi:hypothetical protein
MNAIEWIKEHKWKILIAGSSIVLGGLGLYAISKKAGYKISVEQSLDTKTNIFKAERLNVIDLGVGALDDAIRYNDGTVELWLDNIRLDELGQLGEGINDNIPGLPENANVWALLCIREDRQ